MAEGKPCYGAMNYKRKKKWNKKYRYLRGGWNKEGKQRMRDSVDRVHKEEIKNNI